MGKVSATVVLAVLAAICLVAGAFLVSAPGPGLILVLTGLLLGSVSAILFFQGRKDSANPRTFSGS